ncbi:MAG: sulfite exporter TauE/SafE family protein [Verrucomicrobia bacterium]|nr:sulfite exporter TauE/SafE family protein [Verrucomicrobiota bacterium]
MFFPISGVHINPLLLGILGLVIGILGGFFGVGGSFLSGPSLFSLGMPYNFVVGTDLIHIVGKSIVAARQHRILGHIDLKLATVMVAGTLVGSETGVDAIEALKRSGEVNLVVGLTAIIVFTVVSIFGAWESWQALRKSRSTTSDTGGSKPDVLVFDRLAKLFQGLPLAPRISLKESGIPKISVWSIVLVSYVGGFFSGFLGGGAGYIRMPAMVYLLGIPTHIAVGTDLFEIIISAGYGAIRHAMNGNVDILVALVMHTGAAVGAQLGARLTQYFSGPWIRLAFAPLPLLGAIVVANALITGHHS